MPLWPLKASVESPQACGGGGGAKNNVLAGLQGDAEVWCGLRRTVMRGRGSSSRAVGDCAQRHGGCVSWGSFGMLLTPGHAHAEMALSCVYAFAEQTATCLGLKAPSPGPCPPPPSSKIWPDPKWLRHIYAPGIHGLVVTTGSQPFGVCTLARVTFPFGSFPFDTQHAHQQGSSGVEVGPKLMQQDSPHHQDNNNPCTTTARLLPCRPATGVCHGNYDGVEPGPNRSCHGDSCCALSSDCEVGRRCRVSPLPLV